jgi:quinol monooxygenase YgiN
MLHVHARINVKPESAVAAKGILTTLVNATRKEPGCIHYELFQRPDTPHVFQTIERWTDQAAFDGHMASAHLVAAITAAGPMFTVPPEILTFDKLI